MNLMIKNTRVIVATIVMVGLSSILVYSMYKTQQPPEVVPAQFEQNKQKAGSTEEKAYEVTGPLSVQVVLQREYMDGEASVETKKETIWSMEDFWARYADWQLVDQNDGKIVFKQEINDISPLTKANGYFGISKDGTLTIFNGNPEAEEAIHSFFQIDVGKLESRQHEQLKDGIPVGSKDHYVRVIETFKPFEKSRE